MHLLSFVGLVQLMTLSYQLHPIHVSVTEIAFDEKDRRLEIMMRVFIDDLEVSWRNAFNKPELDIFDPKNASVVDAMARDYLQHNFKIALDNKPKKTVYLGHERESDVFIFYVEVNDVKKWRTIRVQNSIITETYDDQSNLVHVTVREKIRSLRLTKDTPADNLTF